MSSTDTTDEPRQGVRAPERALTLHPAVAAVALIALAVITMCALHPVIAALSLAGALLCSLAVRGVAATRAGVRWQLPAIGLVALANPLFTASGSTPLLRVGPVVVYLESLAFGLVAGAVMVASLLWLACLASVVPPAVVQASVGRWAPTTALAVSMTARLVPLLRRRYETVAEAATANTAANMPPPPGPLAAAVTHSGVLLGWALADSLTCADSMRARGWGCSASRTSYRTFPVRARDACALACIVILAVVSALLVWVACTQWHFYPTMPHLIAWWGYAPFALLCAVPSFAVTVSRPHGPRL